MAVRSFTDKERADLKLAAQAFREWKTQRRSQPTADHEYMAPEVYVARIKTAIPSGARFTNLAIYRINASDVMEPVGISKPVFTISPDIIQPRWIPVLRTASGRWTTFCLGQLACFFEGCFFGYTEGSDTGTGTGTGLPWEPPLRCEATIAGLEDEIVTGTGSTTQCEEYDTGTGSPFSDMLNECSDLNGIYTVTSDGIRISTLMSWTTPLPEVCPPPGSINQANSLEIRIECIGDIFPPFHQECHLIAEITLDTFYTDSVFSREFFRFRKVLPQVEQFKPDSVHVIPHESYFFECALGIGLPIPCDQLVGPIGHEPKQICVGTALELLDATIKMDFTGV